MSEYAKGTTVSRAKSRAELEETLERFGASGFLIGHDGDMIYVAFRAKDRNVRFRLTLPSPTAKAFTHTPSTNKLRSAESARAAYDAEVRRVWRALVLAIKSKLVSVEEGIETFEDAFMAHIMLADGQTVAEHVRPRLELAYRSGEVPPLLPAPNQGEG